MNNNVCYTRISQLLPYHAEETTLDRFMSVHPGSRQDWTMKDVAQVHSLLTREPHAKHLYFLQSMEATPDKSDYRLADCEVRWVCWDHTRGTGRLLLHTGMELGFHFGPHQTSVILIAPGKSQSYRERILELVTPLFAK